jgi:hypothetical protein
MLLLDDGQAHDVFEVVDSTPSLVRARTPFLFEVGEELRVRIERDGKTAHDTTARVLAHVGEPKVTELELVEPAP